MNIMELGAIGELVGGVAVIGSLIYVGLQVRQSTRAALGQSVTARIASHTAGDIAIIGDQGASALATAINKPQELSTSEILQVWTYLATAMFSIQGTQASYKLGLSRHEDWDAARQLAPVYLGFPFGRVWWQEVKWSFPEDFVSEIDQALNGAEPNALGAMYERVKLAAQQLHEAS